MVSPNLTLVHKTVPFFVLLFHILQKNPQGAQMLQKVQTEDENEKWQKKNAEEEDEKDPSDLLLHVDVSQPVSGFPLKTSTKPSEAWAH